VPESTNPADLDAIVETTKTANVERTARFEALDQWRKIKRDELTEKQKALNVESSAIDDVYYRTRDQIEKDWRETVYGEDA